MKWEKIDCAHTLLFRQWMMMMMMQTIVLCVFSTQITVKCRNEFSNFKQSFAKISPNCRNLSQNIRFLFFFNGVFCLLFLFICFLLVIAFTEICQCEIDTKVIMKNHWCISYFESHSLHVTLWCSMLRLNSIVDVPPNRLFTNQIRHRRKVECHILTDLLWTQKPHIHSTRV